MATASILDAYVKSAPSAQNALDIFKRHRPMIEAAVTISLRVLRTRPDAGWLLRSTS